jgi:cytochrome c biogenesis protein CcmG, thiol:disulfide interchange protein DsbE
VRASARKAPTALTALLALAVASACGNGDAPEAADVGAASGAEAPPFGAVTLDGDSVALADLRGSPVLLNVWATWCAPCRQEIPELQSLHERYGPQGLRVIGVTVDSRSAGADIRAFADEFGMTYDLWWDPDQTVVSRFQAMGVPLTVLIGPDGRIRWRHLGALPPGDPELRRALETLF